MSEERLLICAAWGKQVIRCTKRFCVRCDKPVAVDSANISEVERRHMDPICFPCFAQEMPEEFEFGGGMIGGQFYRTIKESLAAARRRIQN